MRAGQTFLENPHETPFIPTSNRTDSADPDFLRDLNKPPAADAAEYA
jgi:glucosyl-3-phosphoglycerate synthase